MKLKLPMLKVAVLFLFLSGLPTVVTGNPRVINEAFALRNVRLIHGAQMAYSGNLSNDEFTPNLETLRQVGLIDAALASGTKHFYTFTITAQPSSTASRSNFTVAAVPVRYGKAGKLSFFVDILGQIRGADKNGEPATASDPIVGDCSTGSADDNDRCAIYGILRLRTAQRRFFALTSNYATFSELYSGGYIDPRLASGTDRGFLFQGVYNSPSPGFPGYYRYSAQPYLYGQSGRMSYYYDETVGLRGADRNGLPATANDPPISVY